MGWFTGSSSNRRSSSSYYGGSGKSHRPSSTYSSHSYSSSSRGHGGTSAYKRRPRDGYVSYLIYRLRKLLHEIWSYARRHPIKIFFLVIMPLISGGALAKLARPLGIALPAFLMGKPARREQRYSGGYYGSQGYDLGESDVFGGRAYGRSGGSGGGGMGFMEGLGRSGGSGGGMGLMDGLGSVGSVVKLARAFM